MRYVVNENLSYRNHIFFNIMVHNESAIIGKYTNDQEHIASSYRKIGIEFLYKKDFYQAINYFNASIKLYDNLCAYIYRGVVYAILGNNFASIADFQKVLDLNPGNYSIHFAQHLYADIIEKGIPDMLNIAFCQDKLLIAQYYFHQGCILAIDEQYQKALMYLNLSVETYPSCSRAKQIQTFLNNIQNKEVI